MLNGGYTSVLRGAFNQNRSLFKTHEKDRGEVLFMGIDPIHDKDQGKRQKLFYN